MNSSIFENNTDIISQKKSLTNFPLNEKDTFYIFSEDFIDSINEITLEENEFALRIMKTFDTTLNDDENVCIIGSSKDIYHILIYLKRQFTTSTP